VTRLLQTCIRIAALLGVALALRAEAPPPEPRTALVVGNGDYSYAPLTNPVHDADAVAKALQDAGFDVTLETDADKAEMEDAIKAFGDKVNTRGGVGLFYFAGHGVQLEGENYLLPVGGHIAGEADIKTGAVTAAEVVDAMATANNALNIVVLDACRNNPINPAGTRGLSRIDSNASLFISYSTSPGAVALDGAGKNSPYTKYLARSIGAPGLSLEETFKRTLKGVYQETKGEQTPWISSTFFGDFVFKLAGEAPSPPAEASPPEAQTALVRPIPIPKVAPAPMLELGGVYRVEGTNPNGSSYRGMVALAKAADGFNFTWWIGKQVFHGNGHFAGKMLVVNWGDKDPVIYTLGQDGALDGEWADGSATETLSPVATVPAEPGALAPGRYQVDGRNPDGKPYRGTVTIAKDGKRYKLSWTIGGSSYQGTGTIAGNLLTVDWGSETPVVYALAADGRLTGLWSAGQGEETLTPAR